MDYLRAGLVIAPQLFAGCLIYLLILKRSEVAVVELLSIGFAIGITTSTICDQIFINLNWLKIGWLLPLFISTIIGSFVIWTKKIVVAKVAWRGEFKNAFFPIVAIAATALGTEWFWLFPSGVFLVISAALMYFPRIRFQRIMVRISLLASAVAMFYMISTRPKIWWMLEENDYPFLQAISSSLSNWGPFDYYFQTGSPFKYHWFVYAWVGLVERSASTQPYVVLTRIAPLIFTLLIVGIVWTIFNHFLITNKKNLALTFFIMLSSSYPLWGGGMKITTLSSPSQYYAFIFSITSLHFLILETKNLIRFASLPASIFAAATTLAKAPHGFVLISGITLHMLSMFFSESSRKYKIIQIEVVMIFTALFTYLLFISGPGIENSAAVQFGGFLWQIQGEARLAPSTYIYIFGVLTIISFSLIPILIFFIEFTTFKNLLGSLYFFGLGSIIFGFGIGISVIANYGENLYFLHAAIVMSNIIGLSISAERNDLLLASPRLNALLISIGVSICIATFFIPDINSGSKIAIFFRSLRPVFGSMIILAFAIFTYQRNSLVTFRKIIPRTLLVATSMTVTFSFVNWFKLMPIKNDEFKRNGSTYLPDQGIIEVASWIRNNSEISDIVASNFGWPKLENDEIKYFVAPCISFKERNNLEETCRRTINSNLSVYLARRSWLQSTSYQYSSKNFVFEERQLTILKFAQNPNQKTVADLRKGGVDWFVVDRSTTSLKSWLPFAEIKYSNDSFFVLKI